MKQLHNSLTMYDLREHTFEHTPMPFHNNLRAKFWRKKRKSARIRSCKQGVFTSITKNL